MKKLVKVLTTLVVLSEFLFGLPTQIVRADCVPMDPSVKCYDRTDNHKNYCAVVAGVTDDLCCTVARECFSSSTATPAPTTAGAAGVDPRSGCPGEAINTAIGCVPVGRSTDFASWFLGWALGIAGGLAFLLIVFSGFQIMTASGNPQQLQEGREKLTAAISGLLFIIFSVFLLNLIGVQILHLPGF